MKIVCLFGRVQRKSAASFCDPSFFYGGQGFFLIPVFLYVFHTLPLDPFGMILYLFLPLPTGLVLWILFKWFRRYRFDRQRVMISDIEFSKLSPELCDVSLEFIGVARLAIGDSFGISKDLIMPTDRLEALGESSLEANVDLRHVIEYIANKLNISCDTNEITLLMNASRSSRMKTVADLILFAFDNLDKKSN